ncbi:MAG: hypothetical protein ACYDAD_03160 [Acidimicrobiales bacterium]
MRKALIITLVVVMLVTGIPILAGGMSMGSCHDCGAATVTSGPCTPAMLVLFGLFIAMLVALMRPSRVLCLLEPVYDALDRPPRLI